MKKVIALFSLALVFSFMWYNQAFAQDGVQIGQVAPSFNLKNVDGKMVSLESLESTNKGAIVVFTCNHCPYSKLYEDRLVALDGKFAGKGYPVVAINPNDAEQYPDDSFDEMKKRSKKKGFTFPYLLDDTQAIAKAYGATRTPHVFLVNFSEGKAVVEYIGAIDDNAKEADSVEQKFLDDAVNALINGEKPTVTTTKAIGCGIKWKNS